MKTISVKTIYDDEYEYNGYATQFNYDINTEYSFNAPDKEFSISAMYAGHYAIICDLPKYVIQDKNSPLRMIITINGHEFTYNIRK